MKADDSIRNIAIAAVKRSAIDLDNWTFSRIVEAHHTDLKDEFNFMEGELPVFVIDSPAALTLITTRRILEKGIEKIKYVDIDQIDDVIYGNFKGHPQKDGLSIFRIIDFNGDKYDFQFETGKASTGLIYSLDTVRRIIK